MDLDSDLHVFAEELTKTIDEFDGQIPEFELDPKSAVLKSEAFVLKLRRIISKAFSEENNSKSRSKSSANSSGLSHGEKRKRGAGKERERHRDEAGAKDGNKYNLTRKSPRTKLARVKTPLPRKRLTNGPKISKERAEEIEKADGNLRSVEIEAAGGFYTLFKCLLCDQDFNRKANARVHVLRTHFKLGFRCKSCASHFFNQESHRRHVSRCSRILDKRKIVNVTSNSGEKRFKVHVYSQPKTPGFSHDLSKMDKSFDPQNPSPNFNHNSNVNARSAKIKLNRVKLSKNKKPPVEKSSKPKGKEENQENKKSEPMEKTRKRSKVKKTSESQIEKQLKSKSKSRLFDAEGATLICGIERSFLV